MYNRFWGFKQKPFRLVPNPDFLFLSATHEEALAHLKFTLSEGEGFLMITGEVGTGKSTLCRAFLEDLGPDVACAYIFNPKLDGLQLLRNINQEFGLSPPEDATSNELIESLNAFLIDQKAADQNVVIIIDEAQNLPVEALEQVRLLSNLETTRDKLLQIVLVGQPELAKKIDSFELRQLGQRISLTCHIKPLSYDETVQYIQYRLNVASQKPQMPFAKGALRAIFTFSGGIPRLINTACDRMLLAACLKEHASITSGLAADVIDELTHRGGTKPPGFPWFKIGIATGVLVLFFVALGLYQYADHLNDFLASRPVASAPPPANADVPETPAGLNAKTTESVPSDALPAPVSQENRTAVANPVSLPEATNSLEDLVAAILDADSRRLAVEAVLQKWGMDPQGDMVMDGVDDRAYFELIADRHGLTLHTVKDDLGELLRLNLPAVVRLALPGRSEPLYASVVGVRDDRYLLTSHNAGVDAPLEATALEAVWGGLAVVPWKNYLGYRGIIPGGAPRPSVVVLKQLLWELGHSHLTINDHYDDQTRNVVREIQAKHGLVVDGLVGDLTKIVLYNEKEGLPIPHLKE